MAISVAILTVSDRVSQGIAEDRSGPTIAAQVNAISGWSVVDTAIVPDEPSAIQTIIRKWADGLIADLIITTGGTGFGVRDVTPEAVRPLLDKEAPGLTTAMLVSSLAITPMASLSRPLCGVRKHSVIVTLPGSTKGAVENLTSILPVLGHAIELCRGGKGAGEGTHAKMAEKGSDAGIGVVPFISEGRGKHGGGHHHHQHGHHHGHNHSHGHHRRREEDTVVEDPEPDIPQAPLPLSGELGASVKSRARKSPYPLAEFDDALATVLKLAKRLDPVTRKVDPELTGFIIAKDVVSPEAVPGYRASVVDGYAIHSADGPGTFPVAGTSTAGASKLNTLEKGYIARVTTGAPVPSGADAVVMVEDTELVEDDGAGDEARVKILVKSRPGANIREPGSDVAVGDVILGKGDLVSAAGGEVGLLASVGVKEVTVFNHPTVAILSTGDELVPYDHPTPIPPGIVRDTNLPSLTTALTHHMPTLTIIGLNASTITTTPTIVSTTTSTPDTTLALEASLRRALTLADVVITTGGVSMGEADLVKPVLERALGATVWFGRVRLKPGKPTTFATVPAENVGGEKGKLKLVFSLPGNPVSAMVGFYLFVLPALRKMAGHASPHLPIVLAKLAHPVHLDSRPEFFRARITVTRDPTNPSQNLFTAHGTGSQMSSRMLSMRGANALLRLPALEDAVTLGRVNEEGVLKVGDVVEAWMVGEL